MSVANEATADEATKKGSGKMMSHPDVKLPSYIGQSITSLLVFIMAATMRGNLVMQGHLKIWMDHSMLIFLDLKPIEISNHNITIFFIFLWCDD